MKNFVIKKGAYHSLMIMRRLGYAPYTNRQGVDSFVRRVHGAEFPRYHLYVNNESENEMICSVHIDQRAPSYQGTHAHGGDYDSPLTDAEIERLQAFTQFNY